MRSHNCYVAVAGRERESAVILSEFVPPESLLFQKKRRKPRVPRVNCAQESTRIAAIKSIIILSVFLLSLQRETTATQVRPVRRHVPDFVSNRDAATSGQDSSAARKQSSDIRCSNSSDDTTWSFGGPPPPPGGASASLEQERLLGELGDHFNLNATALGDSDKNARQLPHLPRPSNLTVLILSWYPPILKLSWNLNELDQPAGQLVDPSKYDFYQAAAAAGLGELVDASASNKTAGNNSFSINDNQAAREDKFDLELALDAATGAGDEAAGQATDTQQTEFMRHLRALKTRRELAEKSLTCFQVTYNIVNSRFRVIEEYPAHLRSIHLERVQPATEYNLRVSAVYLNGRLRRTSQRVQFITPTDNESRRFKENTYRPIHSFPDELREPRIGLAQVRCEELTLVGIALFFWLATICLFFNKWGKIRMLEPYQPAYREQLDVGVAMGSAGTAAQVLGSTPPLGGNVTPGGGGGGGALLNFGSSYNLAHGAHGPQLVAQSSNATTAGGGRHTPSLTSECSQRVAAPLGQLVDSLCMATAAAPTPMSPTTCPVGVDGEPEKQRAPGLLAPRRESLAGVGAAAGPMSSAAAAARKSSMMILCNRRFGGTGPPPGSALDPAGLPKNRRPARPDLNYLFQSKAQALAKASLWWPEAAAAAVGPVTAGGGGGGKLAEAGAGLTAQKFKQGLYRAKFGSATASATTDFETLRRLGKCLAARRQIARPAAGPAQSRLVGPLERLAAQSCDVADQRQQQTPLSDPQLRLLAQIRNSRQRAQQRLHQQQQQEQVAGGPSNSNKSPGVSFDDPGPADSDRDTADNQRATGNPCERSASSGGQLVTRLIRRNHAVDLTSPRDSPRDSFRGTQSLDQSTSDSLALLQAAERKLATCSPSSCTVEEEEEEEEGVEEEEVEEARVIEPSGRPDSREQSDDRLRRLQFLSKLHQHPRIAQSVSSSTLNRQHQQQRAYETSSKANSLSLDSRELGPSQAHPLTSMQPPPAAVESTSTSAEQRKGSKPTQLEIVRAPEHHILIEPPSPPNNKFACPPPDPGPLPPPAEFCTSPGSLETLPQQVRQQGGCPSGPSEPGMRPSASAFAALGATNQAGAWQQPGAHATDGSEHPMRGSKSETRLEPDVAPGDHPPPRLEVCLDGQPPGAHAANRGRFVVAAASSTSDDDDEHEGPAPARREHDAFAKLADSYRASTERRLACARSLAHLSSSPPTANYCPCGVVGAHCATSALAACCLACDDPAAHQSLGADTDQVAVCSCHAPASATPRLLFSIGQHAHSPRPPSQPKRVRQCSHCGSIECASQQAAMALHQMCALRNQRPRQESRAHALGGASPTERGAPAASQMRPRMSSVFAACPTYARSHRDSFAMLRALSQRRSKSAEDIAYLSSLVLQIWAREPNPLLQSASQLQLNAEQQQQQAAERRRKCSASSIVNMSATLAAAAPAATSGGANTNRRQSAGHHGRTLDAAEKRQRKRPRSSLTVANL